MEDHGLPDDVISSFREFSRNVRILAESYEMLRGREGEYVAIGQGKVLGFSRRRNDLLKRYGKVEGLLIDLVTDPDMPWML